jgi:pilus assembly protein FimV
MNQVQKPLRLRSSVTAIVSFLVFSGLPLAGHAAGLGNIVVFSLLGQPLRAEVEVSATREELAGMTAQLASASTFKQANVDYVASLSGIKFSMDKRPNGQPIIKLKSDRPINEPFVDLLLELNWPSGRLLREYTFLLDPPELMTKTVVPVTPAKAAKPPQISSTSSAATRSASMIDDEQRSKAQAQARAQEPNRKTPDQPAEGRNSHAVKHGDSMQKIAGKTKPDGISLEQMLVGLWQANQQAFDGGNMNRLKVGQTLSLPDKATLEATSTKEARKIIVAQSAEWHAYRQKLSTQAARGPAKEDIGQRDTAGKITAKLDDIAAPIAEPKDRLKVSRAGAVGAKGKRNEEDLIARDKALQETNERISSLEKNIAGMQKLIEMKDQQLAALQKPTGTDPAAPAPQLTPEPLASTSPAAPVTEKSAEQQLNPQEPKPGANPEMKPLVPPDPVPEASLVDRLLGSPWILAACALLALLTLFAGYFLNKGRTGSQTT